jgi:proline iminopeptidase
MFRASASRACIPGERFITRAAMMIRVLGVCAIVPVAAVDAQPAVRADSAATGGSVAGESGLRAGEHQIVVDGVRLWYRVAGSGAAGGQPLVFLHGGPGYNSHSFSVLAGPALERSLRVVYFDQRGSGRSERPWTREYSIDRLVEDVEALRRALGVPQVALMGHSFGGSLALEYAAKYPEHVARMVLVGPAADIPAACAARVEFLAQHYADALARARADTAGRNGQPRDDCDLAFNTVNGDEGQRVNNEVMFPDVRLAQEQDSVDAASGLRNTGELSQALWSAGFLTYRFAAHDRIRMPVLILAGGQDYAIGLPSQRALAKSLPSARITEYERAGHFLYRDEPARFTREVVEFLADPREASR